MAKGSRTLASTGLLGLLLLAALGFSLWAAASPGASAGLRVLSVSSMGVAALLLSNRLLRRNRELDATLGQSERYIASVAELALDLHLLVDPLTGELLYVNAAVQGLLGAQEKDFLAGGMQGLLERVHPEDRVPFEGLLRGSGASPRHPEPLEEVPCRLRAEDGGYRWLRVRCQVFHREPGGQADELLIVASDLTEARRLEALLPRALAFESLGSVAGVVVHDLNNALMAIQLQVERAEEAPLSEELQKVLHRVGQESLRASDLSRQLLACCHRGRPQRDRQDLNAILREALPLVERLISDPVTLEVALEPGLPPVLLDPDQIRHAALAMVSLANVSLGALRGEVRLKTHRMRLRDGYTPGDLTGDCLCLEVQDTGRGLLPEQLRSLMVPDLGGGEGSLDPSFLALHWIAREHKGALDATPRPGEGVALRLFIPVETSFVSEETERPLPSAEGQVVLVVEDEAILRGAIRMGLEEAGFTVLEAEDGVEGFALFVRHRERLSCVLLDLTMPRMNGDQLFEEIHALRPDLPVILMSGYSEAEATAALGHRGLAGFLSKPCSMRTVREALGRALEAR